MKELAFVVKTMREIVKVQPAGYKEVQHVKQRLTTIGKRLEAHNRLEEKRAYTWTALLL